jgi:AraC family transcriptional regulator, regulatory protein of adaptative response / methylated-DNA-[protein]-cysteine methyltransferase
VVGIVSDPRIAQAIAYIHENFDSSPSLTDIARHVHVSPFHFHRLFSKQVGASPKHYLQKKQLQMARWWLRRTNTAIANVAKQAGFSSHGHFTSTFHRVVGKSPSEYRESGR